MKEAGVLSWRKLLTTEDTPLILTATWLKHNAYKRDGAGRMLLHECLVLRLQRTVSDLVATGRVDIYAKTKPQRESVLHLSAQYNLPACLGLFLRLGRDHFNLNARDANGMTPLHWAAVTWIQNGDTRCLIALLDWGANPNTKHGVTGKTVLDMLFTTTFRSFPLPIAYDMVRDGARVCGDCYDHWPTWRQIAAFQRSLACCRLASRATTLALRRLDGKVHKDVIALIAAWVELTRENTEIWK